MNAVQGTIFFFFFFFLRNQLETSPSNAGGAGSIPGWGAKIPHASWPKNQDITKEKEKIRSSIVANLKIGPH